MDNWFLTGQSRSWQSRPVHPSSHKHSPKNYIIIIIFVIVIINVIIIKIDIIVNIGIITCYAIALTTAVWHLNIIICIMMMMVMMIIMMMMMTVIMWQWWWSWWCDSGDDNDDDEEEEGPRIHQASHHTLRPSSLPRSGTWMSDRFRRVDFFLLNEWWQNKYSDIWHWISWNWLKWIELWERGATTK